jgi:hypothetical protein
LTPFRELMPGPRAFLERVAELDFSERVSAATGTRSRM